MSKVQPEPGRGARAGFLAALAHDLRSPLNTIVGFSSLLRDRQVDPASPEHDEFLDLVLTSARQLQQLIDDFLDLSALDDHNIEFFPESIDVDRTVAIASDASAVVLDRTRLKQILHAYLSNAIAASPAGGSVDVRSVADADDCIRIEVGCAGEGLSESEAEHLFDPLRPSRRRSRAWLGLALTKGQVEAQGGRVGAVCTPGQGSVLYAVLPKRPHA
jgi:signal transduction histidine kinase